MSRRKTGGSQADLPRVRKKRARITFITHLLALVPYEELPRDTMDLPKRHEAGDYREPDYPFTFVEQVY